jgi:hypothetical protein
VFDLCTSDSMPLSPVNKTKLFALYRKFQEPFFGDPKVREYIHSWYTKYIGKTQQNLFGRNLLCNVFTSVRRVEFRHKW